MARLRSTCHQGLVSVRVWKAYFRSRFPSTAYPGSLGGLLASSLLALASQRNAIFGP